MASPAPRDELLHRLLRDVSRGVVCCREDGVWIAGRQAELDETVGLSAILVRGWAFMAPATSGQSLCLLNLTGFTTLAGWDREQETLGSAGFNEEDDRLLLHLLFEVHLDGNELTA
jgi:hypothetical protein